MWVGPHDRTSALTRRGRETRALSLCHVRIQQEDSCLQAREIALTRNGISQHLNLRLPSLQNCEK